MINSSYKKIILKIAIIAIVLSPILFVSMLFEDIPAVSKQQLVGVDDARRAKKTIKKILYRLRRPSASTYISVTERDINALMSFASRGINNFAGQAEIAPWGLHLAMSLYTPNNPFGDYLNLNFGLEPSSSGLNIFEVSIGKIDIPGKVVLSLLQFTLNMALKDDGGTKMLKAVNSVSFEGKKVTVELKPVPDFKSHFTRYKNIFKSFRDEVAILGDPKVVRIYYMNLVKQAESTPLNKPVSLTEFMEPLFKLAKARADFKLADQADENQAALMAMAIYFGTYRFESLIGSVQPEDMKKKRIKKPKIVLAGRHDLALHFIISAGLKVVSDKGITYSIGEFKELLDAGRGGSGFSFADLAADRAGSRFAEVVTNREGGANKLQRFLVGEMNEHHFFPKISDLPEGLSKMKFERQYINVEAPQYLEMVDKIDSRIDRLPLYLEGKAL